MLIGVIQLMSICNVHKMVTKLGARGDFHQLKKENLNTRKMFIRNIEGMDHLPHFTKLLYIVNAFIFVNIINNNQKIISNCFIWKERFPKCFFPLKKKTQWPIMKATLFIFIHRFIVNLYFHLIRYDSVYSAISV